MKTIKSRENPIYKSAMKLTKKKYRDETGLYLLEGVKPVRDALNMGAAIRTVFLSERAHLDPELPEKLVIELDGKLFEGLSDTRSPQGIIAVAEKREYDADGFAGAAGGGNIVILDRLQDPGNIGTIIRTAEAAGYKGIIMVAGSGDIYAPKVVRSAAGSLLRMPVMTAESAGMAIRTAKTMGKRLTVTSLDADVDCFEADLTKDIALVIGNEGQGVSREFLDSADMKIKIPMEGSIESLNAAVAAGIMMYQSRKRK